MTSLSRAAVVLAVLAAGAAQAETLRCQSVNGNVSCTGSGAAACQTVDGRTTCQSGNGAVVQSFGARPPAAPATEPSRPPGPPQDGPARQDDDADDD